MTKSEIVAHSLSPQKGELISILATFPRIILAEVNTHRMLSKNTSSSRAIPFPKMLESVKTNPFIPIAWQEDHKGMQGTKYLDPGFAMQAKIEWLKARDYAVMMGEQMNSSTYVTKQLCNRLLEPFMWTTMLITGSREGWENFFRLRCPNYGEGFKSKKDYASDLAIGAEENYWHSWSIIDWLKNNTGQAEIHIMELAEKIWDCVNESTPKELKPGEWHIPFEDKIIGPFFKEEGNPVSEGTLKWIPLPGIDKGAETWVNEQKVKISTAMGARTSYTIVGEEKELDNIKMIGLHDRLLEQDPPHSSPLEHCARAMTEHEYTAACSTGLSRKNPKSMYGWCNNFKGFIPYRYFIDNNLKAF